MSKHHYYYYGIAASIGGAAVYGAVYSFREYMAITWARSLAEGYWIYDEMLKSLSEEHFRTAGKGTKVAANPGLCLADKTTWLQEEERAFLREESVKWIGTWGLDVHQKKLEVLRQDLGNTTSDSSIFERSKFLSDYAEDSRASKAPWGSGDLLDLSKLPSEVRYLAHKLRRMYPEVGKLRHVYVESTEGELYRRPSPAHPFSGHEYFVIPISGDLVGTFSPRGRSRLSQPDLSREGWTSRDIDVSLPEGSILRVFGGARFDWGFGIRPRNSALGNGLVRQRNSYLILHFEGPSITFSNRSKTLYPESFAFGPPPSHSEYDSWSDVELDGSLFRQSWRETMVDELRKLV